MFLEHFCKAFNLQQTFFLVFNRFPKTLGSALLSLGMLFIPDLAVEEVSHVFRAAFYSLFRAFQNLLFS